MLRITIKLRSDSDGQGNAATKTPKHSSAEKADVDFRQLRDGQGEIQKRLNECLDSLATQQPRTPEEISAIVDTLNEVYEQDGFRHFYSEIIEVVHKDDEADVHDVTQRASMAMTRGDTLANALREFLVHDCKKEGCEPGCAIHELQQRPGFMKLYDHVNLEAKRAGYDYARAESVVLEIRKAQEGLISSKRLVDDAKEEAKKAREKAEHLQYEMVSILGVFSAIVLAFNASVTFTTSSIAATDTTPPFNVAFIVSIVGLALFNCLYGAFALIYRIIRPE